MGVYYSAKLIVGVPRDEVEDEELRERLDSAPPYYDGDHDAIVGICVESSDDYSAKEITLDQSKVDAAKAKFRELTGLEGKLYLTPCGY